MQGSRLIGRILNGLIGLGTLSIALCCPTISAPIALASDPGSEYLKNVEIMMGVADITNKKHSDEEFVSRAIDAIKNTLKDPESSKIKDVEIHKFPHRYICGKINGKNSFGAYIGYKYFISAEWYNETEESAAGQLAIAKYCFGPN